MTSSNPGEVPVNLRVVETASDLTENKAESIFNESEDIYQVLFENSEDGMMLTAPDGRIFDANPASSRITGYSKEEILQINRSILLDAQDPQMKLFLEQRAGEGHARGELKLRHKNGSIIPVEVTSKVFNLKNGEARTSLSFRDITEKKRAEEALKRSENLYRTLAQNLPDSSVLIFDKDLRFLVAEGGSLHQTGFYPENVEGKTLQEILPEASVEKLLPYYQAALAGLENTFESYSNGRVYLNRAIPIKNDQNQLVFGILFSQDITTFKQTEPLPGVSLKLPVIQSSRGDGVITTDENGLINLINLMAENLTGWKQEEARGKPLNEVYKTINKLTREPQINLVNETLIKGEIINLRKNTLLISRDGREIPISESCALLRGRSNAIVGTVLVLRDVTEEEKITEERLKIERLESVGLLAGGIAHDFNNLLTGVGMNLSYCRSQMAGGHSIDPAELKEILAEVEEAVLRSKNLTQQLLTFAKGGSPIKKATDLHSLIQEEANFVIKGTAVKLAVVYSDEVQLVEIDQGQLGQVIRNIVLNASQAMSGGGRLWIKTDMVELLDEEIPPLKAGKFVRISMRDEGKGIRPEHLSRVFDPYFTTKTNGNGLGLAAAYSIIRQHDGHITVESEVDKGTTFNIFLPLNFSTVENNGKSQNNQKTAYVFPFGPKKILVMDDEEMLLNVLKRMFGTLGKELVVARDGKEALRLYREARELGTPFELVTLDLMVPGGMGGRETMEELLEIDPAVKAIVISGYSNDPVMANYREYGFQAALGKPFQLEDVYRLLAQLYSK